MAVSKSYSDKLKNPKWQKKRLEILNLKGFKCEDCGCEEKELHVHHRFYLKGREVWQYDNDVFQVLCCDCHEKEHSKKENLNPYEKYETIFKQLVMIENKDRLNIENIEYIFHNFLNYCEDDDFLKNLSNACNTTDYFKVLCYNLEVFAEKERSYIELSCRISEIEKFLQTK